MAEHCPKCQNPERVKAGFNNGKQRYKCKACSCFYTRSTPKGGSPEEKRQAVHLYLEGLGFRSIGRFLKVTHVTVQNWIREAGESLEKLTPLYPAKVERIEMDEMWHYVGKKRLNVGFGLRMTPHDGRYLIVLLATEASTAQDGFGTR